MNIPGLKELVGNSMVLFFVSVFVIYVIGEIFTYIKKQLHKKSKKNPVQKVQKEKLEIVYNVGDTSKMYLFEVKQEKNKMKKELFGNVF